MKSIKYLVLLVLALTLTVTSCKKDKVTLTKKEMLTAKSWKLLSSKENGVSIVLEDCEKDDVLTLASDGTYTYNPGANKCYTDDTIQTGSWSLSSDEKYLTIDMDGIMTIVELTESKLVLSITYETFSSEMTFVAI